MNESGAADLTPQPVPDWNITADPNCDTVEYPVAVIKVGLVEDHIDMLYVTGAYASALISGAKMYGWPVEPINFGYRVHLPDDEAYRYADLVDRKDLFEAEGIIL